MTTFSLEKVLYEVVIICNANFRRWFATSLLFQLADMKSFFICLEDFVRSLMLCFIVKILHVPQKSSVWQPSPVFYTFCKEVIYPHVHKAIPWCWHSARQVLIYLCSMGLISLISLEVDLSIIIFVLLCASALEMLSLKAPFALLILYHDLTSYLHLFAQESHLMCSTMVSLYS